MLIIRVVDEKPMIDLLLGYKEAQRLTSILHKFEAGALIVGANGDRLFTILNAALNEDDRIQN